MKRGKQRMIKHWLVPRWGTGLSGLDILLSHCRHNIRSHCILFFAPARINLQSCLISLDNFQPGSSEKFAFEKGGNLLKGRVGNASCWYLVEWRTGGVWCWQIGQTRIVGITYGLLHIAYGLVCMMVVMVAVSYMMMNMIQMHCSYDSL